jgi:anti-sigma factor RsiW
MINCQQFENSISDYLDKTLDANLVNDFVEHLFSCQPCRLLVDDVQAALEVFHQAEMAEAPPDLEARILQATVPGAMLSCSVFDDLISDYFDGFLTAEDFHVFEAHFESCQQCNRLLEGVQAVRDLCRQVEPVEVPAGLCERILQATVLAVKPKMSGRWGWIDERLAWLKAAMRNLVRPLPAPELVTASIIVLATLGFLLVDFSDDRTLAGIYRQASTRTAQLFSRTGEIAAEKDKAVLEIEKVKARIASLIEAGRALVRDEPEKPATQKTDEPKKDEPAKKAEPTTGSPPEK